MVGNKKSDLKVVISDAIDKLARRSNCEYDGLLGSISEDWFPSPLKKEFEGVRNHLLNCYEEEDVREYLRDRKELYTITDIQSVKYTPLEIDDKLDALIYIQSIFDLGKDNGIKAYLGEGGVEVVRNIAKHESKKKGGLATAKIRKENASSDYDAINKKATILIKEGTNKKDIVGIIANLTGFSRPKIYRALKTHPSRLWKKK